MKLRIAQLIVQPILVWDDGEELTPGPELNPISISLSKLHELVESLPIEVATLAEKLLESKAEEQPDAT